MGVQIAKAMSLRVIGIDGGSEKRDLCMSLGCEAFVDFTTTSDITAEVVRITEGKGAHGVIVTASNRTAYELAPKLLRVGGIVMCVGLRKYCISISCRMDQLMITNYQRPPVPHLPEQILLSLFSKVSLSLGVWWEVCFQPAGAFN